MNSKPLRGIDAITLNAYFFSLNVQTLTLVPLLTPILVERFFSAELKGSALGTLRLVSLMLGLLVHTVAAQLSDRCHSRFGRRRPFMIVSLFLEILALIGMGLIVNHLEGSLATTLLFATIVFLMAISNFGFGPAQGLIPDLVPLNQHGKVSSIKALFELPLPVIFVSFTIAKLLSGGNIWGVIWVLIAVKLVCAVITLFIREEPIPRSATPFDKDSLWRLLAMTLIFTAVIILLGLGARHALPLIKTSFSQLRLFKWLSAGMGVIMMIVAVVIGVLTSTRISLGTDTKGRRSFSWWVINRLAFLVGASNLAGFVLYFLQERFPTLTSETAAQPTAILMMVIGLSLLVAAATAGWLTDKLGPKPLLFISGILAFVACIVVVFSNTLLVVYIGAAVIGVASGIFYSANWALGTQLVPKDEAGRWLGISNIAGAGAGAIGAFIGGPIGDNAGYAVLMVVYGVLFLLSTLALTGIKLPGLKSRQN